MLIFPGDKSLELVRAVTGDSLSSEEVSEMAEEALAETGNVILNGCLATMANMLRRPLTLSLPRVIRGDGQLFFQLNEQSVSEGVVLFLYINFTISGRDIRGYIAMLMDLPSLEVLKMLISEFISRVIGSEDLGQLT